MFWLLLVVAVVAGVACAGFVFVVLYRAVSNLIDWIIVTFGNVDAVEYKRRASTGPFAPPTNGSHTRKR